MAPIGMGAASCAKVVAATLCLYRPHSGRVGKERKIGLCSGGLANLQRWVRLGHYGLAPRGRRSPPFCTSPLPCFWPPGVILGVVAFSNKNGNCRQCLETRLLGQVAQVVEQRTENPRVVSATLTLSTLGSHNRSAAPRPWDPGPRGQEFRPLAPPPQSWGA